MLFGVLCLPGDQSHPVVQPPINPLACCICWARLLGRAVFPPWNKGPNSGSYKIFLYQLKNLSKLPTLCKATVFSTVRKRVIRSAIVSPGRYRYYSLARTMLAVFSQKDLVDPAACNFLPQEPSGDGPFIQTPGGPRVERQRPPCLHSRPSRQES